MADDGQEFSVLRDLQVHLKTANIPLDNLSTLAKEGDERNISGGGGGSSNDVLAGCHYSVVPDNIAPLISILDEKSDSIYPLGRGLTENSLPMPPKDTIGPPDAFSPHLTSQHGIAHSQLVEQFLTENVKVQGSGPEVIQSQLYIACFWGIRDIVETLLSSGADANHQNNGTLWTPLHAATFQEHGPILMVLLDAGSKPDARDAEGRTPIDFASASDKIWPHFAAMRIPRTSRAELIEKRVLRPQSSQTGRRGRLPGHGLQMAMYDSSEPKYEYNSDPFIHAAVTGDVLADQEETPPAPSQSLQQPQFAMWR